MKILSSAFILFLFSSIALAQISKEKIDSTLISKGINLKTNGYIITSQYTSKNNGVTYIFLRQTVNYLEIYNANSALHFDKNLQLISFNNSFVNNASDILEKYRIIISYTQAITTVAKQLGKKVIFPKVKKSNTSNEFTIIDKKASSKEIKAKLFYFFKNNRLYKVWNVEFYNDKTGDWWNKRVDAKYGKVIDENNWKNEFETIK